MARGPPVHRPAQDARVKKARARVLRTRPSPQGPRTRDNVTRTPDISPDRGGSVMCTDDAPESSDRTADTSADATPEQPRVETAAPSWRRRTFLKAAALGTAAAAL